MTKMFRLGRWLLAASAAGVLMIILASTSRHTNPTRQAPVAQYPVVSKAAAVVRAVAPPAPIRASAPDVVRHAYIVQASSADEARDAVLHVGGVVGGELSIISAVGASLSEGGKGI